MAASAAPELIQAHGVTMFAFPASMLRLYAEPLSGAAPGSVRPRTADGVLRQLPRALAVLNGPMFSFCPGQGSVDYAAHGSRGASACDVLDFRHEDGAHGISAPGRRPSEGCVLVVSGGRAAVVDVRDAPARPAVLVQLYPTMVLGGRAVARADVNAERQYRSAAGVLRDGRVFFAVGVGGIRTIAEHLTTMGAWGAGYPDGGGSSSLATRERRYGHPEDRAVASFLVCEPAGLGGGARALGYAAAATAVAGGLYWLLGGGKD